MKFAKYYGYNFYGVPVPLGINMSCQYSRGDYVFGLEEESGIYYIVRIGGSYPYNDQEFVKRVIKDKSYLRFEIDPFSKTPEEWREYSENIYKNYDLAKKARTKETIDKYLH